MLYNNNNNIKSVSFSIVGNNIEACSGGCKYCSAAASMNYRMWLNTHNILDELIRIDNQTYDSYRADYNTLTNTLDNDIYNIKKCDRNSPLKMSVDIWGGDPVTSFQYLQDITDFLEDYSNTRHIQLSLHTSTNGLPLLRNEIYDFLLEHNIKIQLSHDGLGQHMRTDDFDPIVEVPNLRKAIQSGVCDWINTTLNFWNPSLENNRQYWLTHLKELFPNVFSNTPCSIEEDKIYRALFIKLNHIYNGDYDIKAINKYGWYNGIQYDQLKTAPYGNVSLHNDRELAEKYNIPELSHVLDDYIQEWYRVYNILSNNNTDNDPYWLPFKNYLKGQYDRFDILTPDANGFVHSGACHDFQSGLKKTTFVIDTTGRYSQCNLIDADHTVLNEKARQPEYCKTCKYRYSRECNSCGSVDYPKKCEYLYRWNQFLEFVKSNKTRGNNVTSCNSQKGCSRPKG